MTLYLNKEIKDYIAETDLFLGTNNLNISPGKLSIYLTNINYKKIMSSEEILFYNKLKKGNDRLLCLWELSIEFREMFESKSSLKLNEWVERIKKTSLKRLNTIVKDLIEDADAVNAATELDANNGLTEGNVNRLKNIKRQMYGRANFNLLRKKVVLSMTG